MSGWQARVCKDLCGGVGMCVQFTPEAFSFDDDGQAQFQLGDHWSEDDLRLAADQCPTSAITIFRAGQESSTVEGES